MIKLRYVTAVLLLLAAALPALAQANVPQFSADLQMSGRRGEDMTGKMYFGGQQVRMEMAMRGHESIMISDIAKKTTYMLMPEQKMYMEFSAAGRRGPNTQDMKPMDPANPCANEEGVTCKKVGTETVNDRSCDKWIFTGKDSTRTVWIDQKLHFPIKMESSEGGTWQMKNLKEGPQAASLFQVPSDYQKMDMGGMMGRRPPE